MDYEQYFPFSKKKDTPALRDVFPPIPHQRHECVDWYDESIDVSHWFTEVSVKGKLELTERFLVKQKQLHLLAAIDILREEK